MKKTLLALILILCLVPFAGCDSDDDGGGGTTPTTADLVGIWVMNDNNGETCTACVVITLREGGTFTLTDTHAVVLVTPGTQHGTYVYDGTYLRLRNAGFEFDATVEEYTGNTVKIGFGTYVRAQ